MQVPLAMEGLSESEIDLICEVFRSGQHTMGNRVKAFEEEFASYFGVKHAVMVNSGSSANLLALESYARTNGSTPVQRSNQYIAVPAILWPTTLWPIIQLGYKALLIDTLPNSLEIDLDLLEEACKKYKEQLVGAILIHPLGKSLNLNRIEEISQRHQLFIIEDTCESIGATSNQRFAGTIGEAGTYSFYFSHHMTTVEGGMVVTNDPVRADNLKSMRAHGWTRNRSDKTNYETLYSDLPSDFLFVTSGFNFRPMEFQGALGSSQLRRLDSFISRRNEIASLVSNAIEGGPLKLLGMQNSGSGILEHDKHSWMALPFVITEGESSRSQLFRHLNSMNIQTRPLLAGDFTNQPIGTFPGIEIHGLLTNSKKIYKSGFMIGNHHAFSDDQVNHLVKALSSFEP